MKVPARGSLSDSTFIEILKDASASPLTGMIRLENGAIIKVVYLQKGSISFASSNEKTDRLTEVLKRAGKLTPEQVQDAQNRLKPNVSLGKTLVELGYITAKDLLLGARAQVDGILHHLLFWSSGKYQILEGTLPREIIHLNLSVPTVIYEGILKTQDRDWILQHIGSPEAVYSLSSEFQQKNETLKLPVSNVVSKINGKRSLHEIAQGSGIDTFELCKTVVALQYLDFAHPIHDEPLQMSLNSSASPEPVTQEPVAEEAEEPVAQISMAEDLQTQPSPDPQIAPEEKPAQTDQQTLAEEETPGIENEAEIAPAEEKKVFDQPEPIPSAAISNAVPEPSVEEELEQGADGQPGKSKLFTVALIVIAIALIGAYFWINRPGSPPPDDPEKQTEAVETNAGEEKIPSPAAPAVIDTTEPQPKPTPKPIALDAPFLMIQQGKMVEAAQWWNDTLSKKKTGYSIQLVIACQDKTVIDTFRLLDFSHEMIVLPLNYKGQNCYRVLFGQHPTRQAAQAAIKTLPDVFLKQASPANVVAISKVLS